MNTDNTGLDNLEIYKLAEKLEVFIYKLTKNFPADEKYRSVNQLRRSSSSVSDNIAEGYGRYSFQDKINKFYIARGEAEETRNGIKKSQKKGFISIKNTDLIDKKYTQLLKQINAYINFLRRRQNTQFPSIHSPIPNPQAPKHPSTQSQSLIETIVAIGIIVTAIVAILTVGLTQVVLGGQSAERVMATDLAREGIEIVYTIVNSNRLDPDQSWPYGLTANDDYILDYDATALDRPATFSGEETIANCLNCHLCRQANDLHTHCASVGVFRRMVTVADGDDLGGSCAANCEKKITSTVYWLERERVHTVTLESRLTDWR